MSISCTLALSSSELVALSADDAKVAFERAGFTNVQLIQLEGSAGPFKPKNSVDHILFAGKTTFSTEDFCDSDARIIIYYFSN